MYYTSFHFPHRLLLHKSVGEFLKLSGDWPVSLRPGRDMSLLVVVQELRNVSLGGLC